MFGCDVTDWGLPGCEDTLPLTGRRIGFRDRFRVLDCACGDGDGDGWLIADAGELLILPAVVLCRMTRKTCLDDQAEHPSVAAS